MMKKIQAIKVISFTAMSDGSLERRKRNKENKFTPKNNANFAFQQGISHTDFVEYVEKHLNYFTTVKKDITAKRSNGLEENLRIRSKVHPYFTKMHERLYIMGHKTVDPHYLKLMDWEALAILFMSDGCGHMDKRHSDGTPEFKLNMCHLTYGEYGLLKKTLKQYLDLDWNINKQGKYYVLRLASKDAIKFTEGIKPYLCDSFLYKLCLSSDVWLQKLNLDGDIVRSV